MKTEMTSGSEMLSDRKKKWHAQRQSYSSTYQ